MSKDGENKTKLEVQKAIIEKDERCKLIENTQGKSEDWQVFQYVEFDGVRLDYACCRKCKIVLGYNLKNGTASLTRHKCASAVPPGQPTLRFGPKSIPKNVLDDIAKKQLAFVAKDLQPLGVTEGEPK